MSETAERGCNTLKSYDQDMVKVRCRELPLTNPLVQKHIALRGFIMLHRDDRRWRGHHHYKVYRDGPGHYYIRTGKRGTVRRYLDRCEVSYVNGEPTLYQFRVKKWGVS